MKKENRKLAQENRAKARRKAAIMKYVRYGVATLACALVIVLFVFMIKKASVEVPATDTSTPTTATTDTTTEKEPVLNKDKNLVVEDGMTVNIDYVGTVDGVEFAGGNTQGAGADLVIGSHTYIDDFEEQLIGHKVGETVDVVVTFPENYGKEELNGKEAVFKTVINGIYE